MEHHEPDREATIVGQASNSIAKLKRQLRESEDFSNTLRIKKDALREDNETLRRRGLIAYLTCLAMVNKSHGFEYLPSTRLGLEHGMKELASKYTNEQLEQEIKFVQLELDQKWGHLDSLGELQ